MPHSQYRIVNDDAGPIAPGAGPLMPGCSVDLQDQCGAEDPRLKGDVVSIAGRYRIGLAAIIGVEIFHAPHQAAAVSDIAGKNLVDASPNRPTGKDSPAADNNDGNGDRPALLEAKIFNRHAAGDIEERHVGCGEARAPAKATGPIDVVVIGQVDQRELPADTAGIGPAEIALQAENKIVVLPVHAG